MDEYSFAYITRKRRKKMRLSQQKFGDALTEKMPYWSLTRQAVSLWEKQKTEPMLQDLFWVLLAYSDWRMDWAIESICAIMPEVFSRDKYGALTILKQTGRSG